ncbi:hypothetical protein ASD65_06225 [Microbacterium sp. Root61]|uniref:hypothetical protein n=1 Tax=Microbacterium sp. Root61 TaxID=1736570 RepID=UPI0006F603E3|nr:hypothetical protein [Microbacterium sp. Root61]KRA24065.1 hypothetical protein ASD65_06225 [Microbacterium sp. Root61]
MDMRIIDLDATIGGVEMPPKSAAIDGLQEIISVISPRLVSLRWLALKRPEAFAPALFSFGLRRRSQVADTPALLPSEGWGVAHLVPAADRLRIRFGADWDPLSGGDTWPRAIYQAIDDGVMALWYLRAGMTVPAALIARTLLERWTLNVANEFDLERTDGEQDEDFISRVWSSYPHESIPRDAGRWWAYLSELLHGRAGTEAFGERAAVPITSDLARSVHPHAAVCQIVELSLRQVRGALSTMAESEGLNETIAVFQCRPPRISSVPEPFRLTDAFLPLEYYEANRVRSEQWVQVAAIYREKVADDSGDLLTRFSPAMAFEALLERRGRAVERARLAFEEEKRQLGDDFDPGLLASKMFRFIAIAETGRILADNAEGPERDALSTAAHAVDGAAHLWLEDSDYSMGCVRVLLEQTARLRVHRLKKERALRLEENARTPSSRWVSYAGWGRLAVLVRAVNEFSHLGLRTRRSGARDILRLLQLDDKQLETGRGSALISVAYMFAFELHARLAHEPAVADLFTETVTLLDEAGHVARLEAYLNMAQQSRDTSLGDPDFVSAEEYASREGL